MAELRIDNDKAIEFNACVETVKNMLEEVEALGVDVSKDHSDVEQIEKDAEREAIKLMHDNTCFNLMKNYSLQSVYVKAISAINQIAEGLKVHNIYIIGVAMADSLEISLNEDPDETIISRMADAITGILRNINNSDTRAYGAEETIVERLYKLAYEIMIQEMIKCGKSKVLEWTRENEVGHSKLNNMLKDRLDMMGNKSSELITLISDARIKSGLEANYLTEELLKELVKAEIEENIAKINETLTEIYKEFCDSEKIINEYNEEVTDAKDTSRQINSSRFSVLKRIGFSFILISLLANAGKVIMPLADKFAPTKVYKTLTETYSPFENIASSREVEDKESQNNKITYYEYSTWEYQEGKFFKNEGFYKTTTSYDITDIGITLYDESGNLISIEDPNYGKLYYERLQELDLEKMGIKGLEETEFESELTVEDLYEEAGNYIEMVIQDDEICTTVPSPAKKLFAAIVLWVISAAVLGGITIHNLKRILAILKNIKDKKKDRKQTLEYIKEDLRDFEEASKNCEELREKFETIFSSYEKFIHDPAIIQKHLYLTRKRNAEDNVRKK